MISRIAPRLAAPAAAAATRSALLRTAPIAALSTAQAARGLATLAATANSNNGRTFNRSFTHYMLLAPAALLAYGLSTVAQAYDDPSMQALSSKEFRQFKLKEVSRYNHDTKKYVFEVRDPYFPITSFVLVRAVIDGKEEVRPYTPIETHIPGEVHLLVKSYPQGKISKYFDGLKPGDKVDIKGPLGKLQYSPNMFSYMGLIAGGTGVTPMLQLIESVLLNKNDRTKINLLFANKTPADILLKEKLDALERLRPGQFKAIYLIDKPAQGWKGPTGFVNEDLVMSYMPEPGSDSLVGVCGPPAMMKMVCGPKAPDYSQGELDGILKRVGYKKDQVFKF